MNINGSFKLGRVFFTFSSKRCAFSDGVHLHKLDVACFGDTIHIHFHHQLHFSTVLWVYLCLFMPMYQHKHAQNGWYSFTLVCITGTAASELRCGVPCMGLDHCGIGYY